jgi:hypothetical protein
MKKNIDIYNLKEYFINNMPINFIKFIQFQQHKNLINRLFFK